MNQILASQKIVCISEQDTANLAKKIANLAKKGDIFALYGTLGAGKSTFSRYFIQHLCPNNEVPSPTFTLVQSYETDNFDIFHYDMYRLKNPEDAYELDIEENFYMGVNLIEWPEKISSVLPKDVWKITIDTQQNVRIFEISVISEEKSKRLKELCID